ncbi:MAG: enoyl-CoA hydratase/isomerase family protein [Bryobacterales bacterium]|nr:enoyl-CoA hydratase/isomerase family protein [Bryobacterales bacterium]
MSEFIKSSRDGGVAVITIDNPPVNALSPGVPEGLRDAIQAEAARSDVQAIVVTGAGKTFIAGADIKEFAKIRAGERPRLSLNPVANAIEDCPKPVVMAVHGTVLGGGLEIAMAGHYRVAAPATKLGQPEVKLGLIPGIGGTQRLPRLVGVAKAAEMCAFGEPIAAAEAQTLGLVDRIAGADLLADAVDFARSVRGVPRPRTRDRVEKLGAASLDALRQQVRRRLRGQEAPLAAIEAVEAAARLPFDEGIEFERILFEQCLHGSQSKALIHVFFGERAVGKVPGLPAGTPGEVREAAVIGFGTMGQGIAMAFANAGIPVSVRDNSDQALARGMEEIRGRYQGAVAKGKLDTAELERRVARITPLGSIAEADLVIEAVDEDRARKRVVFSAIDQEAKPGAILATNTSSLSIDDLASATNRPREVIGLHFFSPAQVMRLLEIVRGRRTAGETVAAALQLAKRLGKTGVVVGDAPGFAGNRIYHAYRREACLLAEEGTPPEAIDAALTEFGMAMGPLAVGDLAGLDVGWKIRRAHADLRLDGGRYPQIEDLMCERGWFGQKTGSGWYVYTEGQTPIPNPAVLELLGAMDGLRRVASAGEIVSRTMAALVNEAAKVLDEGIAARPVDVDIIFVTGYGFPAWRGGPLHYADEWGLTAILDQVRQRHAGSDAVWTPAPLLERLVKQGQTFSEFRAEL